MHQTRPHWTIRKDESVRDGHPWHYQHALTETDPHFSRDHDYGSTATFKEAVAAVDAASWTECGLALDQVPFYGLELGIDAPTGLRTCALDVAGFRYLEGAVAYAETLRGCAAREAMDRAERQGRMVSPMDADDEDLHLPIVGATIYLYDPREGTLWVDNLLSWEPHTPALTS